jgi:hypothetical protein
MAEPVAADIHFHPGDDLSISLTQRRRARSSSCTATATAADKRMDIEQHASEVHGTSRISIRMGRDQPRGGTVRFVKIHDNDDKGPGGRSGLLEYTIASNRMDWNNQGNVQGALAPHHVQPGRSDDGQHHHG